MFYSEDVEIVRELIAKREVDLYNLHLKYKLSPAQVSRSVKMLLKENVVKDEGDVIKMTENGLNWILRNRNELFLNGERNYWKEEDDNSRYNGDELQPFEYVLEILKIIEEDEV